MGKFNIPAAPKFDAPKFDAPKFDAPKFDSSYVSLPKFETSSEPEGPPQEERDASAKQAATTLKGLDSSAKDLERQAKLARSAADVSKLEAKEAKRNACKTRFGGNFLCIRPLDSGY